MRKEKITMMKKRSYEALDNMYKLICPYCKSKSFTIHNNAQVLFYRCEKCRALYDVLKDIEHEKRYNDHNFEDEQ